MLSFGCAGRVLPPKKAYLVIRTVSFANPLGSVIVPRIVEVVKHHLSWRRSLFVLSAITSTLGFATVPLRKVFHSRSQQRAMKQRTESEDAPAGISYAAGLVLFRDVRFYIFCFLHFAGNTHWLFTCIYELHMIEENRIKK